MFNKDIFDKIATELKNKLFELRDEGKLKLVKREEGGCFISVFKDALYEYNDGIILLERLYKPTSVVVVEGKIPHINDDDRAILTSIDELSKSVPDIKTLSEEEVNKYNSEINELCEKAKMIKPGTKDVELEYYKSSIYNIPVKSISDASDEELAARVVLSTTLAMSMYQAIFLEDSFEDGVSLVGIDNEKYVDLVVMPYSEQTKESC